MIIMAVVPFLDEESHLAQLLESLDAQTRPLDRLLLLDDGSTDGSRAIADGFAGRHSDVQVLTRPARAAERDRLGTAQELLAFQWAVQHLAQPWDVIGKVDADVELTPRTIEALERALVDDPGLGVVGTPLSEHDCHGVLRRMPSRPEHVHGATSFFRRQCYEDIAPLPAIVGWDVLDTARARLRGWRTASIEIPDGDPVHLRPMGAQDGLLRGYRRWGVSAYAVGEHPLHVVLLGLRRMGDRPRLLGSINYLVGWALAGISGAPRAEPELRAHVREDQLRRLRKRVRALVGNGGLS